MLMWKNVCIRQLFSADRGDVAKGLNRQINKALYLIIVSNRVFASRTSKITAQNALFFFPFSFWRRETHREKGVLCGAA